VSRQASEQPGRRAAGRLGQQLRARLGSARIVASPLPRARETAEQIARVLEGTVVLDARLSERRFGFAADVTLSASRRLQVHAFQHPDHRHADGETVREHRARVEAWWRETAAVVAQASVVVVSHGGTIDHLFSVLGGAPVEAVATSFTRLEPAAYHGWTLLEPAPAVRVWRLDEVNVQH